MACTLFASGIRQVAVEGASKQDSRPLTLLGVHSKSDSSPDVSNPFYTHHLILEPGGTAWPRLL